MGSSYPPAREARRTRGREWGPVVVKPVVGVLAALLALSMVAGVVAREDSPETETANVYVTVWRHVSNPSLLFVSTRPEGGTWRTLNTPLDMSSLSRSGDYHQSNPVRVRVPLAGGGTASVYVTVWRRVSNPTLLFISTRPEGGNWRTLNMPLDMSSLSRSGDYHQSNPVRVPLEVAPEPTLEENLDALLDGVAEIASPGVPGSLCVYGSEAFPVIARPMYYSDELAPLMAAGRWQAGRVVALGHDGYFTRKALESLDTGRMMVNVLQWAAGGQESPRIGVAGARTAGLGSWLKDNGHGVAEVSLTPRSLGRVDVVAVRLWDQSATEIDALSAFVRAGGGLVTATTGWGWQQLNPELDLVRDYPGNRLLAHLGIQWAGDYLRSGEGFAVGRPPEFTHAGKALDALEAYVAGSRTLTDAEAEQALDSLISVSGCLPVDDTLLAPRLRALVEGNRRWPSAGQPVGETDRGPRLAATLFVQDQSRTPADSVRAHPAAEDFPGPVPAGAPRITRSFTIDTGVPRWHSTGLYAAPGEAVTVTVPAKVARVGGFHVRVGAHTDPIWSRPDWKRMPEISRRFPISATETLVANAFGGLIYVEVPDNAALGNVTVEIEGAVAAPLFVLGETDLDAWRDEIRHAPAPWAEIAGRNMIVTTASSEVRNLDDPAVVAEVWDRALDLSAELAAWPPSTRSSPERFVVDRQIWVGYMHAGYPLMAHLDMQANLVDAEYLRFCLGVTTGSWGFYHEVGHNHQSDDWTFDGTVEVTVNLFTLYIYERLCEVPVAENERSSPAFRARKMAEYDFGDPDFEQWKDDPFLALVMYVQLQQAFGWDAYTQVFATYRDLPDHERPKNDDEKRDQWMVRFSRQVGRNLGPFFEAWGVPTSQAARDSIAHLPEWLPPDLPPGR